MLGSILGLVRSGLEALATFLRLRERAENEDAGAHKQREQDRERADAIKRKVDAVDPSGKRDVVDRLRRRGY